MAGIKGSPAMTARRPASFFVPLVLMNTNMLEAARAVVLREDDVCRTFPSPHDRFAGWAKRMAELQAEAYAIEFGMRDVAIVRPANVYGRHDNAEGVEAPGPPQMSAHS